MKVTVNKPNLAEGTAVSVQAVFEKKDGGEIYVRLGVFANGTTTEIPDDKVIAKGALPVDVVIGEAIPEPEKASPTAPKTPVAPAAPAAPVQVEGA
jgi:hypothetical protein